MISASMCSKEPVISMIRTLPVIGDLTTAEKKAAMPKTMQLTAKSSGIH